MEIHSYFLYGGSFMVKLAPYLQNQGTIAGKFLGISPISEFSQAPVQDCTQFIPWLNNLDSQLESTNAEYFIADLQPALQKLLTTGAGYVAPLEENLAMLQRKEIAVVDPLLLPSETITSAISQLATVLKKHFPENKIILIHTHNSPFWMAKNAYRAELSPCGDAAQTRWLEHLENQFCQLTGCHFVDVTKFYFYRKEAGRPLTNVIFEDECYEDVTGRILDIVSGGSGKADRPDFALSLKRYEAYYWTMQKKPQRIFLNENYFLDYLVLCSGDVFIQKNRKALLELNMLDWTHPAKVLQFLKNRKIENTATKICNAFYCASRGIYDDPNADYALMFRNQVVPDCVLEHLKKQYAHSVGMLPIQINRYNAGYHFAEMMHLNPADFSTEWTVAKPVVLDIFGSCVSRALFNVCDNDFSVNNYWFHVPPFEYRNAKVTFPEKLFPEKPNWKDRLVKRQFEGMIYQDMQDSPAEWLVLDLYSLVSPNNFYYQDCLYGDFEHRVSTALRAKNIALWRENQENVLKALDPWLEFISKKYGKQIVLVNTFRNNYWLGDDDRIYQLKKKNLVNEFMLHAFHYVQSKIDCYGIRIGQYFLPDDRGYMRNTPSHLEDAGYRAAHDIVRYIVDELPEKKIYEQYSGEIHLTHLEQLRKYNSPEVIAEALPLSEFDQSVLSMGLKKMQQWHNHLVELYNSYAWSTPMDAMEKIAPALAEDLHNIQNISADKFRSIKAEYAAYPKTALIISGFNGSCKLPNIASCKFRNILTDKGQVCLTWTTPRQETVRIYRKSENGHWTLLGTSASGKFTDTTASVGVQYWYSLCIQTEANGRIYLGSFTPPVSAKIGIGQPELVSAVHMAGVNTLRWIPVPGANGYRVYCKDSWEDKWKMCAVLDSQETSVYTDKSKSTSGGEIYTVRAFHQVGDIVEIGGYEDGICALPM